MIYSLKKDPVFTIKSNYPNFIVLRIFACRCRSLNLIYRDLCTISIFCHSKAKIVEKVQFTGVNEHFETIFNAAMAKKTTRAKVSYSD